MPTGGGGAVPLTADLCARAIIAAARAYGDDPVRAVQAKPRANERRSLTAAASALGRLGVGIPALERVFQVKRASIYTNRSKASGAFPAAETAAKRAVEFALWRPEAAESVVGTAGLAPAADAPPAGRPSSSPPALDEPQTRAIPIRTKAAGLTSAWRPPREGVVSSRLRPPQAAPAVLADAERPIRELVLEALAAGPLDSMNIAAAIDRKEMAVVGTLNALASERVVACEPVKDGPRRYRWRLILKAAAA